MRNAPVSTLCLVAAVLAWSHSESALRAQESSSAGASGGSAGERILLPVENRPDPIVTSSHVQIENYEGGDVKIRRQVNLLSDESLVNHGQFTEFYKDGQKFAEGRFENGMREGEWTYWFENGQTCKTVKYKEGVPDGAWTIFREDGTRRATRQYINGEPHGTWLSYAADGETVLKEETYENGLAHGTWIERFESGKPRVEEHYERGKRHGKYTEFDEQGQVVREMGFKDGRLDGRVLVRAGGREIVQHYREGQLLPDGPDTGGQ